MNGGGGLDKAAALLDEDEDDGTVGSSVHVRLNRGRSFSTGP